MSHRETTLMRYCDGLMDLVTKIVAAIPEHSSCVALAKTAQQGFDDLKPMLAQIKEALDMNEHLVVIESPYAPSPLFTLEENVAYAKRCMHDCLRRGEAPYASHLLFTQPGILDDTKPDERTLGIEAGLAWGAAAKTVAVYIDHGISGGMRLGIARHQARNKRIVVRRLDDAPVTYADIADVIHFIPHTP